MPEKPVTRLAQIFFDDLAELTESVISVFIEKQHVYRVFCREQTVILLVQLFR